MNTSKKLQVLLLLITGGMLIGGWGILSMIPVDNAESRIWVEGTSNLHDWDCEAEQFNVNLDGNDTLDGLSGGTVIVLATQLECDSNRMNRNTRDALKTDQVNRITYSFNNAEVVDGNPSSLQINLDGQLSIAGVDRNVEVTAEAAEMSDGRYRVTGSVPLAMSDFGIDPPRAMMGALRTADDITVHFDIVAGGQ